MTRHEEVERAARALADACDPKRERWTKADYARLEEARLALYAALSRRDDEKAVAWAVVDAEGKTWGAETKREYAESNAKSYPMTFTKHCRAPCRVVPLYTRPEGHDAGGGKCGTCGGTVDARQYVERAEGVGHFTYGACDDPFHNATVEARS